MCIKWSMGGERGSVERGVRGRGRGKGKGKRGYVREMVTLISKKKKRGIFRR